MEPTAQVALERAKAGDDSSRRWLLERYRGLVLRVAQKVCKRTLTWEDDEASISLIAFNEAIDRYNNRHGKSFDNFAFLHIRNRLVDEFRRNSKYLANEQLVMDYTDEFEISLAEMNSSLEQYKKELAAQELAQELMLFNQTLQDYGINLEELAACSPNHKDTRVRLIQLAKTIIGHPAVLQQLQRLKRLPVQDIQALSGLSRKTIERNRKYLIALILMFCSEEFSHIRENVSFVEVGE